MEPVMPITGACASLTNKSMSPRTSIFSDWAKPITSESIAIPGETTRRSICRSTFSLISPKCDSIPASSRRNVRSSPTSARVSMAINGMPCAAQKRATERPVCPIPRIPRRIELEISSGIIHSYLNFNVANPKRTSIAVMIQKRTMTRGSGQPESSK